ncbi:MAG: YlbF family regulator [Defluviitaleaceae bacterium]|nr:YlbF family regulator [Defluviitaleaceae bacterium]
MSTYYEKARELGNLILESNEAKKLHDARKKFDENLDAKKGLEEYSAFQTDVRSRAARGEIAPDEFAANSEKLMKMAEELKNNETIENLMMAESEFNEFVNGVMNILKFTITGVDASDECGCHGCSGDSCNSCG